MSQNHLKIEPPEIGNTYYGCQNSRIRRHLQGDASKEVLIIHIHTPFMNIPGGFVVQFGQFSGSCTNFGTQHQSDQNGKPAQLLDTLWQYYVHRRAKRQLVAEVTGMGANGCDMSNEVICSFFGQIGDVVGLHGGK